jgi:hypothetical protein
VTLPVRVTVAVLCASLALVAMAASPAAASVVDGLPRPVELVAGSPTSLSLSASPASVGFRSVSALTGRLTDGATGSGVSGAAVQLESRADDGSWAPVASLVTDAGGAVSTSVAPEASTVYRFRFGEPGVSAEASTSPQVLVTVRPLSASLSTPAARVGRSVTVSGALAAPVGARLRLEQRVAGSWELVRTTRTAGDGTYDVTVTPPGPGYVRYRVVRPSGPLHSRAEALLPLLDVFRLHTYSVTTRGAVQADMAAFRSVVAATYDDPRGWLRAHHRFREVERGGDFTVVLSQARYLPAYSWACSSFYSCRVGRYVVINQDRWRRGSPHFPGPLDEYRAMLVNHETGHWLGRGHAYCPGRGRLAPVMQQQSKGMHGCRVNPWPLGREIRAVS